MLLATQPPVTRVTTTVQLTHLGMSGPVRAAPNRNAQISLLGTARTRLNRPA